MAAAPTDTRLSGTNNFDPVVRHSLMNLDDLLVPGSTAIGTVAIATLATTVLQLVATRRRRRVETDSGKLFDAFEAALASEVADTDSDVVITGDYPPALSDHSPALRPEDAALIDRFRTRLEAVEQRLPDASTVEKIASVNEAVLATKLEFMEKELERVRESSLSRWDVAVVVFAVLAGLGALVGLAAAVAKYLV
jgi:hypothetical protein